MISEERKLKMEPLILKLRQKQQNGEIINLNFICTHNSRRSQLAQVWSQIIVQRLGLKNINCYSGGTEVTRVYPTIIQTLRDQGLHVDCLANNDNPVYFIKDKGTAAPVLSFSKKYDHSFNPDSNFLAVMTCADADENCPFIPKAEGRFSLTYIDPKISDNTLEELTTYMERSQQIKSEMEYLFNHLRTN